MKIYVPTKITTVVQAASLLVGTVAHSTESVGGMTEHWVAVKTEEGTWARTDVGDGLPIMGDGSMIGWTAFIAHEVHERVDRAYGATGPGLLGGVMLHTDYTGQIPDQAYHERMVWNTEWRKSEDQG
mgnify:CR=1 FL=1